MLAATALAVTALIAPTALPDAQAAPDPGGVVKLSNDDSGKTFDATVGQEVQVKLDPYEEDGLTFTFSKAKSSDEAVLAPDTDADDETVDIPGSFKAVGEGAVDLVAQRTCQAVGDAVCPDSVALWKVTLNVDASEA
ncbi:hypothetical protein ACIQ6Y_37560 [Streptomyces sp. NPDC096205]|uniref:hypothetical protein n=1 Tax=Streptomyces sp. NPDC096205 TaxID=3366081 RepID=UPI003821CF85